jgi:hypothetical protein
LVFLFSFVFVFSIPDGVFFNFFSPFLFEM